LKGVVDCEGLIDFGQQVKDSRPADKMEQKLLVNLYHCGEHSAGEICEILRISKPLSITIYLERATTN